MNSVVLDASALMAFLRNEPGSERVASALAYAAISTVNLSEILAKSAELPNGLNSAKSLLRGVVPFDEQQAEIAARQRPATRSLGLSLGDRCCLALGMAEGVSVLSADRGCANLQVGVDIQVIS